MKEEKFSFAKHMIFIFIFQNNIRISAIENRADFNLLQPAKGEAISEERNKQKEKDINPPRNGVNKRCSNL